MRTVLALWFSLASTVWSTEPVKLYVKEVPLTVQGKETTVVAIEQADGTHGLSPEQSEGFHVEVVNQLKVPTTIHWHGLVLPNAMDGVPFVTQPPIGPGESRRYDFPLKQSGTYWMHSHYGLQEQLLNSAPLIIWTPEERAKADRQFVVGLSDFSFTPPEKILEKLKSGMPDQKMPGGMKMSAVPSDTASMDKILSQSWDGDRFSRTLRSGEPADIDVKYDALLANRRTIESPEILKVKAGESVLLRFFAASSATNFYIDTGSLEAEILAVDGKAVEPLMGNLFQLAIAQRMDLRVTIPPGGGAFPILAQGEGTDLICGVILATDDAQLPTLPQRAATKTAALDNTQEKQLRARDPLVRRPVDRVHPAALGGQMANYTWTINGASYPNRKSLDVREGEHVEIVFTNPTGMGHPMHLHGHDFQVVEIDGQKTDGALRDTLNIPPKSTMRIAFDANNPGIWAFHCHIIYHLATGMFTILKYDDVDTRQWQPEKSAAEIPGLNPEAD